MKRFRLPLAVAAAMALLLIVAVAVIFSSGFQTWAVRRALASRPGFRGTVGGVSAGWRHVEIKALQWENGGAVLTVPTLEVDVPLLAAAVSKNVYVSRAVAQGWTLDLSRIGKAPAAAGATSPSGPKPASPAQPPAASPAPAATVAQAFAGIFAQLQLPVDVSLDGLDLAGEIILPDGRGRATASLRGGGLGAKRQGKFALAANARLTDQQVQAVAVRGELVAAMATPRTFTGLAARLDASASGGKFPNGVKLTAEVSAHRADAGESYSVAVVAGTQEILRVRADFPKDAQRFDGAWKIDLRDADVAPFALGQPLPTFEAVGEGKFDTDASFRGVHAAGRLTATADRLGVIRPELAVLGQLKLATDFDLAESAGVVVVRKLEGNIAGTEPIATVRSLQAFEFKPASGELRATDPAGELLGIVLQSVPLTWAKPFLADVELSGGPVRGELVASPRGGGVSVRSTKSVTLDGLTLARAGKPWMQRVDLALGLVADYTPHGWQAELNGLTAKSGDALLVALNLKAGQLAGASQPIKATGKLEANLPAMLAQPGATGLLALTAGSAAIDFAASLGATREIQAKVNLKSLAASADAAAPKLPNIVADIRADLAVDGKITFSAPIVLERGERKSDLGVRGTVGPEKDKSRTIDAHVTSNQLVIDDTKVLTAILPERPAKAPDPSRDALPPWSGVNGVVELDLKRVIYSDTFEVLNVGGRLQVEAGMLKLEGLQANLGESGRASLTGAVTFEASRPQPYALAADFVVKEFDPGPLFRAANPQQPPTVEGRFAVASKLAARGARLADLALGAGGEFQLTSKGGTFRGLPVNVNRLVENTSKLAGWIVSAGTAISSIAGRKEAFDSRTQALVELAKGLSAVPYDQLSVVLSRDAALNTTLKSFTLISPEVRLTGSGTALHKADASLLDDSLAMEFTLRARGRHAEVLKYLGALEPQADDFGYAACTLPLRIGGTLGKPDTSELNGRLAALALEKAGVTDKAAELVNRLFGGK